MINMDPYGEAVSRIIKEQQNLIGPIALDQARKVVGLNLNGGNNITFVGDKKEILGDLVKQYAKLFGQTSVEVCKEAIAPIFDKIPIAEIPDILKN